MSLTLTLTVDEVLVQSAFARLADALTDMTVLMDSVGSALISSARHRITVTNTGPDGTAWTQSFRAKHRGGKTLYASGQLERSLTVRAAADHVLVGSAEIHAAIHQFGGVIKAKTGEGLSFALADGSRHVVSQVTMPARPYLGVSPDDEATILELGQLHFSHIIRGLQ